MATCYPPLLLYLRKPLTTHDPNVHLALIRLLLQCCRMAAGGEKLSVTGVRGSNARSLISRQSFHQSTDQSTYSANLIHSNNKPTSFPCLSFKLIFACLFPPLSPSNGQIRPRQQIASGGRRSKRLRIRKPKLLGGARL